VAPIDAHHVLLVAGSAVPRALEDQPSSVVAEVCFRVFATVRQLANVSQVPFTRLSGDIDLMR